MMAPAAIQSSTAGRRLPSGHRSPAGIIAMLLPRSCADSATAFALRRQPARVGTASVESESVAPFAEGRTSLAPQGTEASEAGERDHRSLVRVTSTRSAWSDLAYSRADSSFQRYGKIVAPRDTATSTAVEKEKTSTMITTSEFIASTSTPRCPHSQRISE